MQNRSCIQSVGEGFKQQNNVEITAAIDQPPFYEPGAVISHELIHGFDSLRHQFGPDGSLRDWWTLQAVAKIQLVH